MLCSASSRPKNIPPGSSAKSQKAQANPTSGREGVSNVAKRLGVRQSSGAFIRPGARSSVHHLQSRRSSPSAVPPLSSFPSCPSVIILSPSRRHHPPVHRQRRPAVCQCQGPELIEFLHLLRTEKRPHTRGRLFVN